MGRALSVNNVLPIILNTAFLVCLAIYPIVKVGILIVIRVITYQQQNYHCSAAVTATGTVSKIQSIALYRVSNSCTFESQHDLEMYFERRYCK